MTYRTFSWSLLDLLVHVVVLVLCIVIPGGSRDLVTALKNWAYSSTSNVDSLYKASWGGCKWLIRPALSTC